MYVGKNAGDYYSVSYIVILIRYVSKIYKSNPTNITTPHLLKIIELLIQSSIYYNRLTRYEQAFKQQDYDFTLILCLKCCIKLRIRYQKVVILELRW